MIRDKNFHPIYYNRGLNMLSIFHFLEKFIKKKASENQDSQAKVKEKFGY